ncbi:hypothetical protein QJS10_CPA16g01183 [Acorus calamus]|uniref:Digalactosyldiacylglycerol synthase 2, chloroplastic n=1 Tax=Acorus calamus TaxID=4465 RepID=A0AAV9CY28_ACOCL|nr:hypothetical protein QJS10_CPA16g01183 [Acorus calamus]
METKQHIAIFTTACLPWMTGTAVNPLFRAAYLARDGRRRVTLVVPWLSPGDQEHVYPNGVTFGVSAEQEAFVRKWLEERTGPGLGFGIRFYPGKFSKEKGSILATGDISESIPDEEADIAVLEEPEHLTWYHHGRRWKMKFRRVIGIVHTNYLEYVRREKNGQLQAFLLKYINNWVTHIYCHKVIRLSAATQDLPRSIVCNVHGVNPKFIEIGKMKQGQQQRGERAFSKGVYFIGKMIWSKGYKELLQLLLENQNKLPGLQVDLYGNGEDSEQVKQAAKNLSLDVKVYPGRDHADTLFHDYKVFLNPSTTDVVCTTTAEALAMGKIVICANHPSNEFFNQFPNCRQYYNRDEFVKAILKALAEEPFPVTDEQRHQLSWEAASERFVVAAELDQLSSKKSLPPTPRKFMSVSINTPDLRRNIEDASAYVHNAMSGIEVVRRSFGAFPKSLQPDEQQRKELGLAYSGGKGPKH